MRRAATRLALLLALLSALPHAVAAAADAPREALESANHAYEEGRYEDARARYQALVDLGLHHETVYYNLGCASARLGRYGEANLAFRRALRYAPAHADARANLEWVRSRLSDAAAEPGTGRVFLERAAALAPLDLALTLCVLLLNGAALLAALALARRGRAGARAAALCAGVAGVLALLIAAPAFLQLWLRASDRGAVVIEPRIEARSGPAATNPTLFSAHEGLEVEILDERGSWVRVAVPSGPSGWVPCDALLSVAPERLACSGERSGEAPPSR